MRKVYSILILVFFALTINAQVLDDQYFKENHEVYFSFNISDKQELTSLSRIISIDKLSVNTVYAYANLSEFRQFEQLNFQYTVLTHPGKLIQPEMSSILEDINDWNVYPTYDAYITMMYQFQANYPALCRIVDAGLTVQGRKILFAVISDSVNQREPEPQFMYTSSIHGDETTGYVLMLRLIDSLLTAYSSNPRINNIVNNAEIWINPLANPDGTYRSGNSTVYGAVRYNFNGYDLNRNFPDPIYGVNPNQQIETARFRAMAEANNFALVANFHGGTEVVNYAWDTWTNEYPDYKHHPDEAWYQYISHLYADTCQANAPSNYMNGFDDGITNGGAWYIVNGGRQDYTNYYRWGREVTIEISDVKLVATSQLPAHWNYNRKSFIRYMENVLHGVNGIVTDTSGNPIKAKVTVLNHDTDNSEVFSDSTGFYVRMLAPGTYSFKFDAADHFSQTINNVMVSSYNSLTNLNVELVPSIIPVELTAFNASVNKNEVVLNWTTVTELNNLGFEIQRKSVEGEFETIGFVNGKGTTTEVNNYSFTDSKVDAGKYSYRLMQKDFDGTFAYSQEVEVEVSLPLEYSLEQNYPNPFNPTTTIRYAIPQDNYVSIKLYDVLGNEVMTLVNEQKQAGRYEMLFNASGIASGVYYYQITSGSFIQTRKLVLMK